MSQNEKEHEWRLLHAGRACYQNLELYANLCLPLVGGGRVLWSCQSRRHLPWPMECFCEGRGVRRPCPLLDGQLSGNRNMHAARTRNIAPYSDWIRQRVRDRSIELRKVKGEVNPADLFTKCHTSQDRMLSLVHLFNCEYRDGCPESAPLLCAQSPSAALVDDDEQIGQGFIGDVVKDEIDEDYGAGVLEAKVHDVNVLPHMHGIDDIEDMLPKAEADPEIDAEFAAYELSNREINHRPVEGPFVGCLMRECEVAPASALCDIHYNFARVSMVYRGERRGRVGDTATYPWGRRVDMESDEGDDWWDAGRQRRRCAENNSAASARR